MKKRIEKKIRSRLLKEESLFIKRYHIQDIMELQFGKEQSQGYLPKAVLRLVAAWRHFAFNILKKQINGIYISSFGSSALIDSIAEYTTYEVDNYQMPIYGSAKRHKLRTWKQFDRREL